MPDGKYWDIMRLEDFKDPQYFIKDIDYTSIICVNEDYTIVPNHISKLPPGKIVNFEGLTFKVVYTNNECVMLEPVHHLNIEGK